MNRQLTLCTVLLLTLFTLCPALAADQDLAAALTRAMTTLGVRQADPDLLVLTNAPYVRPGGKDCLALLDQAQEATGARVGKGNLLFFQRPQTHPFCLMLFKKADGKAAIITGLEPKQTLEFLDLGPKAISDPEFWKTAKDKFKAGPDLFTLAAVSNAWAKGAPYDFLKSAELHNHICPGVTSGYLLAHYIMNHYPLAPGERYTVIASPVWCKEDAIQVILDATPGKHGLVVKPLSDAQKDRIAVANPAGFLLVWNAKAKTGKGVALSFDFSTLRALYPKDTPKAATILYTASHLSTPDKFVTVAKEFDLNEPLYNTLTQAGANPYEAAGLLKP